MIGPVALPEETILQVGNIDGAIPGETLFEIMVDYQKRFNELFGKHVHIIALLQRDQEIGFIITHQATHIVRSKSDINFWGLPSYESIKPFVEQQYDLLIDTIGEENFFSQYVALRTTASLKVVYATPAEDPSEVFDLIIRGDGQVELKGFFNNVIEYLSMIKK